MTQYNLSVCICNRNDVEISERLSLNNHCSTSSDCPTWFICNSENRCQCGDGHNNAKREETFLGSCFYSCAYKTVNTKKSRDLIYNKLGRTPQTLLNQSVCSIYSRKGLLCGDCEDGYSPLVLSYNLSCVECPDGHKNWWKFTLVAFVPLTLFYFFILLCNINVTSSRLHVWTCFYQSNIVHASIFPFNNGTISIW